MTTTDSISRLLFIGCAVWLHSLPLTAYGSEPTAQVRLGGDRALDLAWDAALRHLTTGTLDTAGAHLESMAKLSPSQGFNNLFYVSDDLLARSEQALKRGETGQATALVRYAERLAPASDRTWSFRFHHAADLGIRLTDQAAMLWKGLRHWNASLVPASLSAAYLHSALIAGILLFGSVFGFAMLVRHGRLLAHDVSHVFPASFRGAPALCLIGLGMVIAPALFGVGAFWLGLGWCALTGRYQSAIERGTTVLVLCSVLVIPWASKVVIAGFTAPASQELQLQRCSQGRCSEAVWSHLGASKELSPGDAALLHLAKIRVKAARRVSESPAGSQDDGMLAASLATLTRLRREAPQDYRVQVAWAVGSLLEKWRACRESQTKDSVELAEISQALSAATGFTEVPAEAHFNQAIVHYLTGEVERGITTQEYARTLAPARVAAHVERMGDTPRKLCSSAHSPNVYLMVPELMVAEARARQVAAVTLPDYAPVRWFSRLAGPFPLQQYGWPSGVLFAAFVLSLLYPTMPAHSCQVCSESACGRCARELYHVRLCPRCLHQRVRGSFIDVSDKWSRSRKQDSQAMTRRHWLARLRGAFPGLFALIRRRAVAGTILLFCAVFGIALLVVLHGVPVSSVETSITVLGPCLGGALLTGSFAIDVIGRRSG